MIENFLNMLILVSKATKDSLDYCNHNQKAEFTFCAEYSIMDYESVQVLENTFVYEADSNGRDYSQRNILNVAPG